MHRRRRERAPERQKYLWRLASVGRSWSTGESSRKRFIKGLFERSGKGKTALPASRFSRPAFYKRLPIEDEITIELVRYCRIDVSRRGCWERGESPDVGFGLFDNNLLANKSVIIHPRIINFFLISAFFFVQQGEGFLNMELWVLPSPPFSRR